MKRVLLGMFAALGLSSCSQGVDEPLAGTIGTGNTAGVAGVKLAGSGSEIGAKVYIYKSDSLAYPVDSTRTDAQGNYRFDKLQVGSYRLFLDQNGLVGAFQDVVIKEDVTVNTTVELRPYMIMQVDTLLNGYCGVGANRLVSIGGAKTLLRIPQQAGALKVVSDGSTELSVAWDSVARSTTLSQSGKILHQEVVAMHDGLVLASPVSKIYDAGIFSVWNPLVGMKLRVNLVFSTTAPLGDTTSLISYGNAFSFQIDDTALVLNTGLSRKLLASIPRGVPQHLEVSLDGSTGKVSAVLGSRGALVMLSLSEFQVTGLPNAAGRMMIGSSASAFLLYGTSVDLITTSIESAN